MVRIILKKWGFLVLLLLLLMGRNPLWNEHAQVDIWIMWQRVEYFLVHDGSWKGMVGNEILPATLISMLVPLLVIPRWWENYANYLPVVMLGNLLVLWWHAQLVKQKEYYWLILFLFGPLLLFRYDSWVTLAVLLGLINWVNKQYGWSGWWLGIAIGMKIFPVILIPYLIILALKEKRWQSIRIMGVGMLVGLLIPVLGYYYLGGNWSQIVTSIDFHKQKLISIESLPGSIITGWQLLTKQHPPAMIAGNGIWAVEGPVEIFNKLWLIPISIYYLIVLYDVLKGKRFDWLIPLCLMLIFLTFSKNLNPQYLWWFIPLLAMTKLTKNIWRWVLLAVTTNQIVFPVYYSYLTNNFFLHNQSYWIYYVLLIRNISIVIITYLSLTYWWHERKV